MRKKTDPVLDAVSRNDINALGLAIEAGCHVDIRDRLGRTPLANAVVGDQAEIVAKLLLASANPNTVDTGGLTPLHLCARNYSAESAKLLLGAGALVDAQDLFGNTPLSDAVFDSRGRSALIDILLAAGADQHIANYSGVSARALAFTIANYDVRSLLPGT